MEADLGAGRGGQVARGASSQTRIKPESGRPKSTQRRQGARTQRESQDGHSRKGRRARRCDYHEVLNAFAALRLGVEIGLRESVNALEPIGITAAALAV